MIYALQPQNKTLRHNQWCARRDTESAHAAPRGKPRGASERREESGGPVWGESAGRDSVRWTQISSAARCVSVCARETFWMCAKHNEGVNALIIDFQQQLAFIQDTLCFSFKLQRTKTTCSYSRKQQINYWYMVTPRSLRYTDHKYLVWKLF